VWQHGWITRRQIDEVLAQARARLRRLTPHEAAAAMHDGSILVDTRDGEQRSRDGSIPGSVHVPLSVLEWRVDPSSGHQSAELAGHEDDLILICHEGYSSSLAAARLHELGFTKTTDVIGGFVAWAAAGLPVERSGAGPR
jgi:rhodanese-related sulfurtransferase